MPVYIHETLSVARLVDEAILPHREAGAAGFDIAASAAVTISPGENALVPTGLCITVPPGTFGLLVDARPACVHPDSAVRMGVLGGSDHDEVRVTVRNQGEADLAISPGDAIAQLLVVRCSDPTIVEK